MPPRLVMLNRGGAPALVRLPRGGPHGRDIAIDRSNVGLAWAGLTTADLTPMSSGTITTPGQVISNRLIIGGLTVKAPNVQLINCKIDGQGTGFRALTVAPEATGFYAEGCEFEHASAQAVLTQAVPGGGYEDRMFKRCSFRKAQDACGPSNATFVECWFGDNWTQFTADHFDVIQGGSYFRLLRCRMHQSATPDSVLQGEGWSYAVWFQNSHGRMEDSVISASIPTFYSFRSNPTSTELYVVGNEVQRSAYMAARFSYPPSLPASGLTWADNFHDDGTPLLAPTT